MNRETFKRTAAYFGSRLTRFLLLAVILTTCLSAHMVTRAKYAASLFDYSGAVGGNFHFSSNYLDEPSADRQYVIGSWAGADYEVTLAIRNYDNSLLFNHEGTDFFYYLTATVYNDAACTEVNAGFVPTITYNEGTAPGTIPTYTYKLPYIAGSTDSEQNYECAFLPGMSEYDRMDGSQNVHVKVVPNTTQSETRYLVIRAYTVPFSEMSRVKQLTEEGTPVAAEYATTRGVYYSVLQAMFVLQKSSTTVNITPVLSQSASDYAVLYKLKCDVITGGTSSSVKVYFDDTKMDADGTVYIDTDTASPYYNQKYIKANVYSSGVTNLYFFKKTLNMTVTTGDGTGDIFWVMDYGTGGPDSPDPTPEPTPTPTPEPEEPEEPEPEPEEPEEPTPEPGEPEEP